MSLHLANRLSPAGMIPFSLCKENLVNSELFRAHQMLQLLYESFIVLWRTSRIDKHTMARAADDKAVGA